MLGAKRIDPPKPVPSAMDLSRIPVVSRLEPRRSAVGADWKSCYVDWTLDGGGSLFVPSTDGYDWVIPAPFTISEIRAWSKNGDVFDMEFDLWQCKWADKPATVLDTILPAPIVITAAADYSDRILANVARELVAGNVLTLFITSVANLELGYVALIMERSI